MATITSSLRMMDQMTPILRSITSSLNLTLTAMNDVQGAMDSTFDANPIDAARRSIQQVELALNDLPSPIDEANRNQERFNRTVRQGDDVASSLLKKITGFAAAYMGIRSSINFLSGGFEKFKTFEQSMSSVKALSRATEAEFSILNDTAKSLGATTAFSASQAADGMGFLAMAGYKTNDIVAAMPGLLSAAAAGKMELGQTADIVSNILSGFGLRADETARVADVLTAAFTSANVDLAMLGETMKYIAPNARAAGFALEEMAAATGILGSSGIQASMAGTSLRSIISRMAAPTGGAAKLMKEMNISVIEADGSLKSMADIIDQVTTATQHMGEAQQLAAVKTLVGEEAASAFLTLMDSGPEKLREFTAELENSAGTAEEIAGIMLDNTAGKLQIFSSQVESAWINFYEGLAAGGEAGTAFETVLDGLLIALDGVLSVLEQVIIYAAMVVNFFTTNWAWIEPIVVGLGVAIGGVVLALVGYNAIMAISNTLQAISAARAALATGMTIAQAAATTTATGAQIGLNAAMLASPITWIILAIVALIAVIVALVRYFINLWKTNDEFAAALMRAWNSILNFFDQVPIFFVKVAMGIVNTFQDMRVKSLEIMEQLVNGVIDSINWLIEKLNKIPGVAIDAVGHVEFSAGAAAEAEAIKQAGEAAIAAMEQKAADKAAEREQKVLDFLEDRAARRAEDDVVKEEGVTSPPSPPPGFPGDPGLPGMSGGSGYGIDSIGKVGEVGKIKNKVDISSEDLKTMRELAEMKNIQNFVTLTPTVNVRTGPVQNGQDVNSIVSAIKNMMEEEIVSSAEGVYG